MLVVLSEPVKEMLLDRGGVGGDQLPVEVLVVVVRALQVSLGMRVDRWSIQDEPIAVMSVCQHVVICRYRL